MTAVQAEDIQLNDDQKKKYNQLQKKLHDAEVGLARICATKEAQCRCFPLKHVFDQYGRPHPSSAGYTNEDLERLIAMGLVNALINQADTICDGLPIRHGNDVRKNVSAVQKAQQNVEVFREQLKDQQRRAQEAEQNRQQAEREAEQQRQQDIQQLASDLQKDKAAIDKGIKLLDALDRLSGHAREARRLGLVYDYADGVSDEADEQLPANFNDLQRQLKRLADDDRDLGAVLAPVRGLEDMR
jgi:hypothetical protein